MSAPYQNRLLRTMHIGYWKSHIMQSRGTDALINENGWWLRIGHARDFPRWEEDVNYSSRLINQCCTQLFIFLQNNPLNTGNVRKSKYLEGERVTKCPECSLFTLYLESIYAVEIHLRCNTCKHWRSAWKFTQSCGESWAKWRLCISSIISTTPFPNKVYRCLQNPFSQITSKYGSKTSTVSSQNVRNVLSTTK